MRDRLVTSPWQRMWLVNGLACALHVALDARGQPERAELRRKRDDRPLARLLFRNGSVSRPARLPRLGPDDTRELRDLLARVRHGGAGRSISMSRQSGHVGSLLRGLDLPAGLRRSYRPPACPEPARLTLVGRDAQGRRLWLEASTARGWRRMQAAAQAEGVVIHAVSGFRSADYQAALVARKRARGQSFDEILRVSALPGYSEHHLGTALDVHDGNGPALEERFERSPAFAWLRDNAGRYGFRMSYPRDNPWGIAFEPWHWRHHGTLLPR